MEDRCPFEKFFFLWLCLHNNIPTCKVLGSKGLNLSHTCPTCTEGSESIDHMLRGCKIASELWQKLEFPLCLKDCFNKLLAEWLQVNCRLEVISKSMGIPWKIIFILCIWQIWPHRNEFVFRTGRVDPNLYKKCIQSSAEFFSIEMKTKIPLSKTCIPVSWQKPLVRWAKLNIDGSAVGNPGRAGGGGVIGDHSGNWI